VVKYGEDEEIVRSRRIAQKNLDKRIIRNPVVLPSDLWRSTAK
jgi:hypothetical protein